MTIMTRKEFEELVNEGILAIPEQFRSKLSNVALLLEREIIVSGTFTWFGKVT